MKAGYIVGTVLETIIKVVVIAGVVLFAFKGASQAYDFGYRVFADQPVSVAGGRTITVGISENMTVKDIAQMLEEKGLIEDARLFVVQELLSAYHKEIKPGIYDGGTDAGDHVNPCPAGHTGREYGIRSGSGAECRGGRPFREYFGEP